MNEYENAVLNYSHAIRLNPKSAETYFDRGTAYEMLRRYDAALSDYRKAATLKYRVSDVYFHIGVCCYHLQKYGDALDAFTEAIKIDDANYIFYEWRGNTNLALERRNKAEADFDAMKRLMANASLQ